MTSLQQSLTVPVRPNDTMIAERQAALERALKDLRIHGAVALSGGSANHTSFNVRLLPGGKMRRAILLADDVAEGASALTATVRGVDDNESIAISLQYKSYYQSNRNLASSPI